MNRAPGTTEVRTGYKKLVEARRDFFRILEEFFERATRWKPAEFAALEEFGEEIKKNAHTLASRAPDALGSATRVLPGFYNGPGKEWFANANTIGGGAAAVLVPGLAPLQEDCASSEPSIGERQP